MEVGTPQQKHSLITLKENKMKVWKTENNGLVKAWIEGVPIDEGAKKQISHMADLPFVTPHVAIMPDVHVGMGATIGSVIPTYRAIIPAAVGVDIGCGMSAVKLNVMKKELLENAYELRYEIEKAVPHGRTDNGGENDRGAWGDVPDHVQKVYDDHLHYRYSCLTHKIKDTKHRRPVNQLGTLGTGNHFIEICTDENDQIWVMLHSGSRGPGNRIASTFIRLAKKLMNKWYIDLEDFNLAYFPEDTEEFKNYVEAVMFAQDYAKWNRQLMIDAVIRVIGNQDSEMIDCHHNYIEKRRYHGKNLWITRKGATGAGRDQLAIIPGSMGTQSYIVEGLGNQESFRSCSHGAGRVMSRTQARNTITLKEHEKALEGIECRKDKDLLDESPAAYKSIEAVMTAQQDLVKIKHTLKQIICIKG